MSFPSRPNQNRYSPYQRPNQNLRGLRADQMSLAQRLELERNPVADQPSILGDIPTQPVIPQRVQQTLEPPIFRQIPVERSLPLLQTQTLEPPIFRRIPLQGTSPTNPEDNQHLYQIFDNAGITIKDINSKPWTGVGKDYHASPDGKSFKDKEMLDFLRFTKENPKASPKEVKGKFNCVGQNCATNTVFGLSKMRARTKDGNSPRSEILKHSSGQGIDLDEALGMSEEYRDKDGGDTIPKGTVAFLKNPEDEQGMPFDHVAYAENDGMLRSLNSSQDQSLSQTLKQVKKQGGYTVPPYNLILSKKFRNFFS